MDFRDDDIRRVAELAGLLTPLPDIAVLTGIDEDSLRMAIAIKSSPVSAAYRKAKAETALRLRRQELELAEAGSPLAVQHVSSYLLDMDSEEDF